MTIYATRRTLAALLGAALMATAAQAADIQPAKQAPDLSKVRAAIKAKNYSAALTDLKALEVNYKQADVYSLMGFALRKTGDRPQAMTAYQKALALDPNHKGALEYQGELFVEMGQMDNAQANLAKLKRLCPFGCEEQRDLKEAIEQAPKAKS